MLKQANNTQAVWVFLVRMGIPHDIQTKDLKKSK